MGAAGSGEASARRLTPKGVTLVPTYASMPPASESDSILRTCWPPHDY